jgi:hypothetical protein
MSVHWRTYVFILFHYYEIEKCIGAVVNDGRTFCAMLGASLPPNH